MDTLPAQQQQQQQHDTLTLSPLEEQVVMNQHQEPVVTVLPATIRLIEDGCGGGGDDDYHHHQFEGEDGGGEGGYGEDEAYGEDEEYYDEAAQHIQQPQFTMQQQQQQQQQPSYYRDDSSISFINDHAIYETSRDSNMIRIVPRAATTPTTAQYTTTTTPSFVKVSETHTEEEILPQLLQQSTPLQMHLQQQQSPILSAVPPIVAKPARPASPITLVRSDVVEDEVIQEPAIPAFESMAAIPHNAEVERKAEQEAINLVRRLSMQPSPPDSFVKVTSADSPVSPKKKQHHEKKDSIPPHAPPADPAVYSPIFQASPSQVGLSPETSRKKQRAFDKLKAILSLRRRSALRHPPKKQEMMYNVVVIPDAPAATQEESRTIPQPLLFSSTSSTNLYTPAPTTSTTGLVTAPATQEITVPVASASPMTMQAFASPSQVQHLSPELDAIASTSITPLGMSHLANGEHGPSPVLTLQQEAVAVRSAPQPVASYTQVIEIAPDPVDMATRRPVPLEQFVDPSACTPQFITSLNPNAQLHSATPMTSLVDGHVPLIDEELREKLRRRKEVLVTTNVTAENSEAYNERSGVKQFLAESKNKAALSELHPSKPELSLAQVQVLQVEKLEIKNLELSDELLRLLMRIVELNKTSMAKESAVVSPFVTPTPATSPPNAAAAEEGVFNSKEQYEKAKLLDYEQRERIELLKLKERLELPARESAAMQCDDPYIELLRREKERHIPGVFHEHLPAETHYKQLSKKQRNEHKGGAGGGASPGSTSASSKSSEHQRSSERLADEVSWSKELAIQKAAQRKLGAGKQSGRPTGEGEGDDDDYLSMTSDNSDSTQDTTDDPEEEEGDEQHRDQRDVLRKEEEQMLQDKLQREKLKRWQMKERRAFLEHHQPFDDERGRAGKQKKKRSRSHSPAPARPQQEEDFFHNVKDKIKHRKHDAAKKQYARKEKQKQKEMKSEDEESGRVSASIRKYEKHNAIMNVIRPLKRIGIDHGPWIGLLLAILIGWILVFTGRI